jgi:uncharacterized RDD family membrane protein YckC
LGLRIGAFLIDEALLALQFLFPWELVAADPAMETTWLLTSIAYFAVLEGLWGASLGKRLLRLRVYESEHLEIPGIKHAAFRAALVSLALALPPLVVTFLPSEAPRTLIQISATLGALFALAWPMRRHNGFCGLHDRWGGTRVVQLPWPEPPLTYPARTPAALPAPLSDELPKSLGVYRVDGVLARSKDHALLAATDPLLGRGIIVFVHRPTEVVAPGRRNLARPGRPRWLTAGIWYEWAWDAFVASGGRPLRDIVSPDAPLSWAHARPILEQLTSELIEAERDGSLPAIVTIDQVHVRDDGRVQLLDWPLTIDASSLSPLELTQHAAMLLLEGRLPRPGELPRAIRAPVPAHGTPMLERLMGLRDPGPSLQSFAAQLDATRDRPRRVGIGQKVAYLSVMAALLVIGLASMFTFNFLLHAIDRMDQASVNRIASVFVDVQNSGPQTKLLSVGAALSMPVVFWPMAWSLWAFAFRGGFTLRFTGLRLVRRDGRPASRMQCAFRTLVVWMPITLMLLASNLLRSLGQQDLALTVSWCALGLLGVYVYFSLLYPTRSIHDWIAGTWLVPE